VAYVANRTASVRNYGTVNNAKLDVNEGYFARFPSRVGTFKGLMYADASEISTATHLTAVEFNELGIVLEGLMLPHINE
jgi:hypothetical protein